MRGEVKTTLNKFFLIPLKSGILGLIIFLVVLFITKSLGNLVGTVSNISIDTEDFLLASIGFIMFFLIKVLENFNKEKT